MTPEEIVAFLEKNPRSTVKDIGTDNATMYALEKKGAVRKDGIIRGEKAGRGRPPTAWVVADGKKAAEVEAPGTKGRGTPEHVAKMHKGKEKKRQEREKAALKEKKDELKALKAEKDQMPEYGKAVKVALDKNTKTAWSKAEQLQNAIIGRSHRIRVLESELV